MMIHKANFIIKDREKRTSTHLAYRPDIDGMRAIAVLSVMAFHIWPKILPGGFLGVDIFFVISGYLITLILIKNIIATGRLNLTEFYKRRIKRIIPVLMLILIVTFILGYLILMPQDFLNLCTNTIWAIFSAANIYFYLSLNTDYFAPDSSEIPLLHLWSLGIEEQFYLLWPFFIGYLIRLACSPQKVLTLAGVIFLSSLWIAQTTCTTHQLFAYYMLPSRIWELMAGGICAIVVHYNYRLQKFLCEIIAIAGIICILFSLFFISKKDYIPGIGAIPAVLGTSWLLVSSVSFQTLIERILSLRPFVAIGLISYSLYLWHWPILAFIHYVFGQVTFIQGMIAFILAFALSILSYFIVEQPLRKKPVSTSTVFFGYFMIPATVLSILCLLTINGIQNTSPYLYDWSKYHGLEAQIAPAYMFEYNCQYSLFDPDAFNQKRCVYPENTKPSAILIGDSNAAHYLGMLRVFADHFGFSLRNATQNSCPLLLDGKPVTWVCPQYNKGCNIYLASLLSELKKYDTIIVGGSWNNYDEPYSRKEFRERFSKTIKLLATQAKLVIILGKVPVFPNYNKNCEARAIRAAWLGLNCREHVINNLPDHEINLFLQDLSTKFDNVKYFNVRSQLCRDGFCSPYLDGKPVYFNTDHLSMEGSIRIGKALINSNSSMIKIFNEIEKKHF